MDLSQLPTLALWTTTDRDREVLIGPDGTPITAGAIIDSSHRIARQLRAAGVGTADAVAFCLPNCPEILALALATAQVGIYLVPLNWHLTGHEIGYILGDCGAKIVVCGPDQLEACDRTAAVPYVVGGSDGQHDFAELDAGSAEPPPDRTAGGVMTYTSGTTGQPKGVRRPLPPAAPEPIASAYAAFLLMYGMTPGAGVHLVTSPLYHTAVLYFATSSLHLGHTVVVMDKWTPQGMLERIQEHRVTHTHMVPTQFVRLLDLDGREAFDTSSLQHVVHSAAPCPIDIKRQMLAWWGPVIFEYYAASEGGGTMVTPQEWLQRPGTVGRPWATAEIAIFDDDGNPLGPNEVGTVYIKMQQGFEYHQDRKKTEDAWRPDGFFTVGDAGFLDADGYLFLRDRKVDLIISGGVNIYPAEVEGALIGHPRVLDVAVFGVPDDDWGESVKAVIEPKGVVRAGLDDEILSWVKERLASYKCPRTIDFVDALPRDPNGKLRKRLLRDPYWPDGALPS
jgi:long-chain acyl-CoA synthetase